MDQEHRARIIRANLEATSRGSSAPRAEQVGVWIHELRSIPDSMLDQCIRRAREEHAALAEAGKAWGRICPDDALRVWRRMSKKSKTSEITPPENRHCPLGCEGGRVVMVGADKYEVCVRCSCPAGKWWEQFPAWRGTPDAAELQSRGGYELRRRATMPDSHKRWIADRADQVGHRQAITDYLDKLEEQRAAS